MFSVNEDGMVVYSEDVIDNGTLFGSAAPLSTDPVEDPELLEGIQDDISVLGSVSGDQVSSGDIAVPYQEVTYYTVYAVPSGATGFPNSNSVAYLEDVVQGYPLDYGYVAYRTDDSYAQSMILFIGPEYSFNDDLVTIEDCDVVELSYRPSSYGSGSYIDRSYYHEDIAEITLADNTLAYSNIAPGYAAFETTMQKSAGYNILTYILIGVAASFILGRLIGGRNHD